MRGWPVYQASWPFTTMAGPSTAWASRGASIWPATTTRRYPTLATGPGHDELAGHHQDVVGAAGRVGQKLAVGSELAGRDLDLLPLGVGVVVDRAGHPGQPGPQRRLAAVRRQHQPYDDDLPVGHLRDRAGQDQRAGHDQDRRSRPPGRPAPPRPSPGPRCGCGPGRRRALGPPWPRRPSGWRPRPTSATPAPARWPRPQAG